MSILAFSDVHLGDKSNSTQGKDGLATTEKEARLALEVVLERAKQPDIDMVICAGDIFHTSHPTTKNIEFLIDWLYRLDEIGKPFFAITGNHDSGIYSNSVTFMNKLRLKNGQLIDSVQDIKTVWHGIPIYFIPFINSVPNKDASDHVFEQVKNIITKCEDRSIVVMHVYDSDVMVGSESTMIARFTSTIDFDAFSKKDMLLLLGHAHRHQSYTKSTGIRICYPGSLYYASKDDANQTKGYAVIEPDGTIHFEGIPGLRSFVLYGIPEGEDVVEYVRNIRTGQNKLVFLNVTQKNRVDESALREVLFEKGCSLGSIKYTMPNEPVADSIVDIEDKDHYKILSEFLVSYLTKQDKMKMYDSSFHVGKERLEHNKLKNVEG